MFLHNWLLLASTLQRPSVKECLKAKRVCVCVFFFPFLSEYFDDCLPVTEECALFEDEPQHSDQTFTLLARCCGQSRVKALLAGAGLRLGEVDLWTEQCVDIERLPILNVSVLSVMSASLLDATLCCFN